MGVQLFANNAASTLASGITSGATACTLAAGQGALFPNPTGGDWFMMTLTQGSGTETTWEVVKVTGRSGDSITSMVRAQENTSAAAWGTGSKAELRDTAGPFTNFEALRASKGAASGLATLDANVQRTIGEAQQVTTVATTTASLSPGQVASPNITMNKVSKITKILVDHPAWVRIYQTSAYRAADASRLISNDAPAGAGLVGEVYTTSANQTIDLQPVFNFVNADGSPANVAYLSIQNKDVNTETITVTLSYRPEA